MDFPGSVAGGPGRKLPRASSNSSTNPDSPWRRPILPLQVQDRRPPRPAIMRTGCQSHQCCVTSAKVRSFSEPPHPGTHDLKPPGDTLPGAVWTNPREKSKMLDVHDLHPPPGEIWIRRQGREAEGHGRGDLPDAGPRPGLPRLVLPDPPRSSSLDHTFHLPLPCRRPPGPQPTCFGITFKEKFLFSSHPAWLSPPPAPRPGCGPCRALVDTSGQRVRAAAVHHPPPAPAQARAVSARPWAELRASAGSRGALAQVVWGASGPKSRRGGPHRPRGPL